MNEELEKQKREKERFENELIKKDHEKNEILQLYEKMDNENKARKRENSELKDLMEKERNIRSNDISRESSRIKDMLEKEKERMNKSLEDQRKLSLCLEDNLARKLDEGSGDILQLKNIVSKVENMVFRPQHYFCAVREEPYCTGGEEYLTFTKTMINKVISS